MHAGRRRGWGGMGVALACALVATSVGCADVRGPGVDAPRSPAAFAATPGEGGHAVASHHHHDDAPHGGVDFGAAVGAQPAAPSTAPTGAKAAPDAKLDDQPYRAPLPELAPDAPASRLADLSERACLAELDKRGLPYERAKPRAGVATPLHLTGPLRGVRVSLPGKSSPHGVIDCRLALALDEFAAVLSTHGVTKLRVDNTYRPGARLPGKKKSSQHAHAMAIDLTELELADGRKLVVEEHHTDAIGQKPCGPEASIASPSPEAVALRNIVCDVARRGIFHHMLTPSFDAAHRDHYHFDLRRDTKRQSVR